MTRRIVDVMAQGVDISYAQANYRPGSYGESFIIINASRANTGSLVTGSYYRAQVGSARGAGKEVGHYFFNGNIDPVACADYFVSNLYDFRQGDTLWLDVESEKGTGTVAWSPAKALLFINRVKARGLPAPGVYLNQSIMNGSDWSAVVAAGAKLWIAYYNPSLPAIRWWPGASVWQYTSTPIDLDRTVGAASLAEAGNATAIPPVEEEDMGLPISFVHDAKSASIWVLGPAGYVGVQGMYHLSLLQRAQKNNLDDPMLQGEMDIVASYLRVIGAVPAAAASAATLTDAQLESLAAAVATKITAAPQAFTINLTGKAQA